MSKKNVKTETKVKSTCSSRIPEMLARLMVRPAGISKYVSVRGVDRHIDNTDKSLKVCVTQQTTYSYPYARGYWLEKDPQNRFFDIYVIKSVGFGCIPTRAHEHRIHLGSSSRWFSDSCYYGDTSAPIIELPLNWNEKLYYFRKDYNTDADGNPININCIDLSKVGPKGTYGMLKPSITGGTSVSIPKSLFVCKKFIHYNGQYYYAESAETNTTPLKDVICAPYVQIGYRVYANQKIYMIYGCLLTDENGTPDRTIYMAQCNKKVRCQAAKPIPAPDEWDKDVLKYVTPVKINPCVFHGIDVKYNLKKDKKFDLHLWAVTAKRDQQTMLSEESVKIIEDVIGKDNAVYVTEIREGNYNSLGKANLFIYASPLRGGCFSNTTLAGILNRVFSKQFVRIKTDPDTGKPSSKDLIYMKKKEYNLFVESTNTENIDTNTESGSIVSKTAKRVNSKKYLDELHNNNISEMISNGLLYLSVSEIDKIIDFFDHNNTLRVSRYIIESKRAANFGITARIKYKDQWYSVIKYVEVLSINLNHYNYYTTYLQDGEFERNFRNLCKLRLQEKLNNNYYNVTPATDVDLDTIVGTDKHNIVKMKLHHKAGLRPPGYSANVPTSFEEGKGYTSIGLYSIYVYPDNPGSKAYTGFYIPGQNKDCTKVHIGRERRTLNCATDNLKESCIELDVQLDETDVRYEKVSVHNDTQFCALLIDFADVFSLDKFSSVFPKCMSMHFTNGLPNIYSTKPLTSSSWYNKYSINYILNDELSTPPKYLRTAYEHAETHGVPKLLVKYADHLNNWCKRPKGKSDTVKNIYYRSLSDILYELPHSKILILGELSTPLIESGGCIAAMTLVKVLETLLVTSSYRTVALGINAITDDTFRKILSSVIKSISCITKYDKSGLLMFEYRVTEWFRTLSTDLILMSTAFAGERQTSVILNLYTDILNKIAENLLPGVLSEVRDNASTASSQVGNIFSIISDTITGIRTNVRHNRISANWHLEELSRVATIVGINEVHNSVVNANNAARDAQYKADMAKIQAMYEGRVDTLRKKFEYVDNDCGYAIVVPKKLSEIITEGSVLSHCVGSYTEKVANGITNIMFLRNTKDLGMPFMTIEVYHGEIRQIHGRGNNNIKDQNDCAGITRFLGAWCKEKNIHGLQDRYSLACAPQV